MTAPKLDNFGEGFVPGKVKVSDQVATRAMERDYQQALNRGLGAEAQSKTEGEAKGE